MVNFSKYECVVFDCDGVILNSNKIKTEAFYNTALPYGEEKAEILRDYHVERGGVSRYKKFAYFVENVLDASSGGVCAERLIESYSDEVYRQLLRCEVSDGLYSLRKRFCNQKWFVVSGGDQNELRDVFARKNLSSNFQGGIYGSPDSKSDILNRLIDRGEITKPTVFLGDSKLDSDAANDAGLDFLFISGWTEFHLWRSYCDDQNIKSVDSLRGLIDA